jgi:hypothetical protein
MRGLWTIPRASGAGFTAELVALILWPVHAGRETLDLLFAFAAGVAGLCGASILLMTGLDLLFHRRRGDRVRPLRAFDIVFGSALVVLSLIQLDQWGQA